MIYDGLSKMATHKSMLHFFKCNAQSEVAALLKVNQLLLLLFLLLLLLRMPDEKWLKRLPDISLKSNEYQKRHRQKGTTTEWKEKDRESERKKGVRGS